MSALLTVLLGLVGLVLLIPCAILGAECLLAWGPAEPPSDGPTPRYTVLMPAHDEAAIIEATLATLALDEVLLVADNCTDDTAAKARAAGAKVVERNDPERRGKGYAISHGVAALAEDPPEVVIVVDADCRVAPEALDLLARQAHHANRPIQAEYTMEAAGPDPRAAVSAFAFLVRNRVRPRGLAALGMPCHLTGSGMAFPYALLRDAPPTESAIVEDLVLGLELTLRGKAPLLSSGAQISSALPEGAEVARGQRTRWEHGSMSAARAYVPKLLASGRLDAVVLALDLLVPPLALLGAALAVASALGLLGIALGASATPIFLALAAFTTGVGAAYLRDGLSVLPPRQLPHVARYVLWKLPIYAAYFARRRLAAWNRTDRT